MLHFLYALLVDPFLFSFMFFVTSLFSFMFLVLQILLPFDGQNPCSAVIIDNASISILDMTRLQEISHGVGATCHNTT